METHQQHRSLGAKTIAVALALGTVAVIAALFFMGSQVSGILSTVGASVGNPYQGGYGDPGDQPDQPDEQAGNDDAGSGSGDGSAPDGGPGPASGGGGIVLAVPRDELLVIKTGRMTIQVADVTAGVTASTDAIAGVGGYASGSRRSGSGEERSATVTFRIPSAAWDAALNALRRTGLVLDEETSTEDVTTKVVDLGARIRNLQATERALQAIMDKASVIKDVLSVQDELTETRGQIEQLTAEKAHLEEQAAYSTMTATFQLQPAPAVVVAQTSGFDAAKEVDGATARLIRAAQRVARAAIWFGIVWVPILLVIAIGVAITFFVGRRFVRWWERPRAVEL
ncbi:MAG TPA: DUF4349 domain-containing protein [Candidatus Limnocylindrales bacterium]|nr:DUF4349 domain-containing protein [Candidatus Limnocylindrales bacterium]